MWEALINSLYSTSVFNLLLIIKKLLVQIVFIINL